MKLASSLLILTKPHNSLILIIEHLKTFIKKYPYILTLFFLLIPGYCLSSSNGQKRTPCSFDPKKAGDRMLNCHWVVPNGFKLSKIQRTIIVGPAGKVIIKNVKNIDFSKIDFIWNAGNYLNDEQGVMFEIEDVKNITFHQITLKIIKPNEITYKEWLPNNYLGGIFKISNTVSNFKLTSSHLDGGDHKGFYLLWPTGKKNNWLIKDNKIQRFYYALGLTSCKKCIVESNSFVEVSSSNIMLSGEKIIVRNNKTWLPGHGIHGDSISIGNVNDIEIKGNNFIYGYCYGIWFNATAKNVTIEDNLFAGGITSGLAFQNTSTKDPSLFTNILIKNNFFYNNTSKSILVENGINITISDNFFVANKPLVLISEETAKNQNIIFSKNKYLINRQAATGDIPEYIADELRMATIN